MRKLYYLKPDIQYALTRYFILLNICEFALLLILFYLVNSIAALSSHDVSVYIRFSTVFVGVLLLSGFNFWVGVRLSHRFTGPMVQVQRALEQALKGRYDTRIRLRDTDYLHEIGDGINALLEQLEQRRAQQISTTVRLESQNKYKTKYTGN